MTDLMNSTVVTEDKINKEVKLSIAISSNRGWAPLFGRSFGAMMLHIGLNHIMNRCAGLSLTVVAQAYLVTARQDQLDSALTGDFTHLLYLDDDQTFPYDVVDRLLKHDKDIVTCNYRKKTIDEVKFVCADMNNEYIDSRGKTGLERIFSGGMGVTLIRLDKLRKIPKPHFGVVYQKELGRFIIEDCFFANVMKFHGVEMYCDHDLSQEVGHIGEYEYRISAPVSITKVGSKLVSAEDVIKSGIV